MTATRCNYILFPHGKPPLAASNEGTAPFLDVCSLNTGFRYQRFKSSSASTSFSVSYDFKDDIAPDYFYIARLDLLSNLTKIELKSSADGVSYTAQRTWNSPFSTVGVNQSDFYDKFTALTAARYWQVVLSFSASTTVQVSKIYFGEAFNLKKEPVIDWAEVLEAPRLGAIRTTSQRLYMTRVEAPRHQYELKWEGVQNAEVKAFLDKVQFRANRFVGLANTTWTGMFDDLSVIHGVLSNIQVKVVRYNYNEIKFLFTEMLG